jgi:hypothetical protein
VRESERVCKDINRQLLVRAALRAFDRREASAAPVKFQPGFKAARGRRVAGVKGREAHSAGCDEKALESKGQRAEGKGQTATTAPFELVSPLLAVHDYVDAS